VLRVYCDKIMRDMFDDEDVALESARDPLSRTGGSSNSRPLTAENTKKKASGDSSYYATSIAVRAVLSESQSHDTRRFLKMNTHGAQPHLKAKYKSRADNSLTGGYLMLLSYYLIIEAMIDVGAGCTGEPSVFTTGSGSMTMSFEDSGEIKGAVSHSLTIPLHADAKFYAFYVICPLIFG
jgi:hypothetical protein